MTAESTTGPTSRGTSATPTRSMQVAAAGAAAATLANVMLWLGGRAADVGFLVSTPDDPATQVGIVEVIVATLLFFGAGSGLLALAARRSRRWVRTVLVAAGLVAVVSAVGPVSTALDAATGALLAAMHLVTGTAFLVTCSSVKAR